jgi:hypothetical protein
VVPDQPEDLPAARGSNGGQCGTLKHDSILD